MDEFDHDEHWDSADYRSTPVADGEIGPEQELVIEIWDQFGGRVKQKELVDIAARISRSEGHASLSIPYFSQILKGSKKKVSNGVLTTIALAYHDFLEHERGSVPNEHRAKRLLGSLFESPRIDAAPTRWDPPGEPIGGDSRNAVKRDWPPLAAEEMFAPGSATLIDGALKGGKSTALNQVAKELRGRGATVLGPVSLIEAMEDGTGSVLRELADRLALPGVVETIGDFVAAIDRHVEGHGWTAVLIDDINGILGEPKIHRLLQFFARILPANFARQSLQFAEDGVTLLYALGGSTVSVQTAIDPAIESIAATFNTRWLPMFALDEVTDLAHRYAVRRALGSVGHSIKLTAKELAEEVSQAAIETALELWEESGGHPYLVQYALDRWADTSGSADVCQPLIHPTGPIAKLLERIGKSLEAPWQSYFALPLIDDCETRQPLAQLERLGVVGPEGGWTGRFFERNLRDRVLVSGPVGR